MTIEIDESNLKEGILSLVIGLTEIIVDALRLQAIARMESGLLSEEEIERLGSALMDLDMALETIQEDYQITDSVRQFREGLDNIVDDLLDRLMNPERWERDMNDA